MAAKKKKNARKSSKKQAQTNWFQSQLFRLCFLICMIGACFLALGRFGIVGQFLFNILGYFIGTLSYIILLATIAYCIWYIWTRGEKKILRRYKLAAVCFGLAILVFLGCENMEMNDPWMQVADIFRSTFGILFQGEFYSAGLIGAISSALFVSLFDKLGTNVIMIILLILGTILVLYDWIFLQKHEPIQLPKPKLKRKDVTEKEIYQEDLENLIHEMEPAKPKAEFQIIDVDEAPKKEEKINVFPITLDEKKPKKERKA